MEEYLRALWQGEAGREPLGYRALADLLNKRILRSISIAAGRQITTPLIESEYETLQGDDPEAVAEVRTALSNAGIDAAELESAFVSHMAIRRHFQNCLDLEPIEREPANDWHEDAIEYAERHLESRVEQVMTGLARSGKVPDAETATFQPVFYARCSECPTRVTLETAIDQGYVCDEHV
jgi:hypothetical protein